MPVALQCPHCNKHIPPGTTFEWHRKVGCTSSSAAVRESFHKRSTAPRFPRQRCPDCKGLLDLYHPDRPGVYVCVNPAHKTAERPGIWWVVRGENGRLVATENPW